jgi:hypothetical protein
MHGFLRKRFALLSLFAAVALVGSASIVLILERSAETTCPPSSKPPTCSRILFIGNSYTYVNDLPDVFGALARSGGHAVEVGMDAEGGWTLSQHASSGTTRQLIASKPWDVIVLQEQSEIPSVEQLRQDQMFPAARELIALIQADGARPLMFETWAHRSGWPENGSLGYDAMQSGIDKGYHTIAQEQHVAVVPVGEAWRSLLASEGDPGLWQDDGSHPTIKGTYLAACVFYAAIFNESPQGLTYRASLSTQDANALQVIAGAAAADSLDHIH